MRVFCTKVLFCKKVTRKKLREALLYEKPACKMLMKLTPGGDVVGRGGASLGDDKSEA